MVSKKASSGSLGLAMAIAGPLLVVYGYFLGISKWPVMVTGSVAFLLGIVIVFAKKRQA